MIDDQNSSKKRDTVSRNKVIDDSLFSLPSRPVVGFRAPAKGAHDALIIGKPIVVECAGTYFEFIPELPKDDKISELLGYNGLDKCSPSHFFRALYSVVNLSIEKSDSIKGEHDYVDLKLKELLETFMGGKRVTNARDPEMLRLVYQLVNMLGSSRCNEYVYNKDEDRVTLRQGNFIHLETSVSIQKNITGEVTFRFYSIRESLKDEANLLYLAERRGDYWENAAFIGGSFEKKILTVEWRDYVDRQISLTHVAGDPIGTDVVIGEKSYDGRTVALLKLPMSVLTQISGTVGDRLKIHRFRKELEDYFSSYSCVLKIAKEEGEWKSVKAYVLYIALVGTSGDDRSQKSTKKPLLDIPIETP